MLFKKGIFIATLYLETPELIDRSKMAHIFGSFTKNPWNHKVKCVYDRFFKCFKADRVRIMVGHQFKFIANDGQSYLVSNRYGVIRDSSGNANNFYDPRK